MKYGVPDEEMLKIRVHFHQYLLILEVSLSRVIVASPAVLLAHSILQCQQGQLCLLGTVSTATAPHGISILFHHFT